ncbi:extracellular solute-binding protein [Halococcus sp. IIIV-5B]|uniref:extracellular solute-binding protein n=1 Tax=Halococcus sp. IIIV-5B TaxID=2321230 RepID=UPI001314759D|nr:extracellular solute-binding protein [Halococcus sp. IIIV-5B]
MIDSTRSDRLSRRRFMQAAGTGAMLATAGCTTSVLGSEQNAVVYGDREDTADRYAQVYNQQTDGTPIDFTLTDGRYRDIITKVKAGANVQPLLGLDIVRFAYFSELEVLRDITDFYNDLPYTDDFLGSVGELFTTRDGAKRGVPYWIDSSLYFYNKRLFEQAGLDPESPPGTWAAFRQALEQLDSQLDLPRPPLGAAFTTGLVGFLGYPFIWSNGGRIVNDDETRVLFDERPSIEALEYWVDINNAGLMTDPLATNWEDWHNMFVNEQIPIMFTGGLGLSTVQQGNEDLFNNRLGTALFPKPAGGTRTSFLGGDNLTITTSATDDELDTARDFVRWANTDQGMQTTLELGFLPGRERGFEVGLATQEPYPRLLDAYQKTLENGNTPIYADYEEIDLIITNAWSRALSGTANPAQALRSAAREANTTLMDS